MRPIHQADYDLRMKVTHVSFWPPDDGSVPRTTLRQGIVKAKDDYTRVSVSDGLARSRGLPMDVEGWCVFVSRIEDGESEHVYEGTVTRVERAEGMAGQRRIFRCSPAGLDVD